MRIPFAVVALGLAAALVPTSRAAEEQKWGTVKGQVTFAGEAPLPEKINVDKDQQHCLSKGPLYSETWVVNPKNNGVRWAFVWLTPVPDPDNPTAKKEMPVHPSLKDVPKEPVVMDQPCCRFEPHCLAMRQGQTLIAKNSAPIVHNVHWAGGSANPGDNKLIPAGAQIEVTDLKPSRFPVSVKCDIHGWMQAWVRIFDNPYFAVTDENGAFEIKNAPAGTYHLVVWHEGSGWRDRKDVQVNGKRASILGTPVTIKADGVTDVGRLDIKKLP
jgi:hypothetical protein